MRRGSPPDDLFYMREALALARKGAGHVSPNPLVGCVIVKSGRIVGAGYHRHFGGPHAEVYAIRSAGRRVRGGTLYVNMEPCDHFGKTPPCTDIIIKNGIKRVVIGMKDPNPIVSGRGISKLRRSGIDVHVGIMNDECRKLNEFFETFITRHRPFVTLKTAQTIDGKIFIPGRRSRWITNSTSRSIVHGLRSIHDAVLVGGGTVRIDDPKLTVRHVRGRNPVRVVIDGPLKVSQNASIFSRAARTLVITTDRVMTEKSQKVSLLRSKGAEVIAVKKSRTRDIPVKKILSILAEKGISSIMVEGGAEVNQKFLEAGMVDKLLVFIAPVFAGKGTDVVKPRGNKSALFKRFRNVRVREIAGDILVEAYM